MKRYTFNEDDFIVSYYEAIGSILGPHNLGRSRASVVARVAKLKTGGGWDAIRRIHLARYEYDYAMHPEARGYMDPPE